jgi:hypothetical protein
MPYEGQCHRSHSAAAYPTPPSSTSYASTFARHTGIILLIARKDEAMIGTVVATVVYSDLLYNQGVLAENMQIDMLN